MRPAAPHDERPEQHRAHDERQIRRSTDATDCVAIEHDSWATAAPAASAAGYASVPMFCMIVARVTGPASMPKSAAPRVVVQAPTPMPIVMTPNTTANSTHE